MAIIRPEKRKWLESDSSPTSANPEEGVKRKKKYLVNHSSPTSADPEEDVGRKKKDLVGQLCKLFNTRGASLEVEELTSILNLSKSLINKSKNV